MTFAQSTVADDTTTRVKAKKPDSLREKFYPRTFRFGTDVLALILSRSVKFSGWELNGDIDFGKYYAAVDIGSSRRDYILSTGGSYHNEGTYWRAGMDANLLKKDPDRNMFFMGLRYAHSSWREEVTVISPDPYFGATKYQLNNQAVTAGWGEITTGLRVKVWKEFWMGITARMKFALHVDGGTAINPYDVPGYGTIGKGINWGFNYQVFWRIPFSKPRKAPPLPISK